MAAASRKNQFKVVLLGEGCVGKTSLMLRYVQDKFNEKHLTTLQVSDSPSLIKHMPRHETIIPSDKRDCMLGGNTGSIHIAKSFLTEHLLNRQTEVVLGN